MGCILTAFVDRAWDMEVKRCSPYRQSFPGRPHSSFQLRPLVVSLVLEDAQDVLKLFENCNALVHAGFCVSQRYINEKSIKGK